MAQVLTDADVRKIAALAHLELSPDDVAKLTRQLADILTYAEQVQQVDTAGVEPTSHPLAAGQVWRDDTPAASLARDAVLAHAPGATPATGLFKVPKVL